MNSTINDLRDHVRVAARALRILERIEAGDRTLDWMRVDHLVCLSAALPALMDYAIMGEHRHGPEWVYCGWCGDLKLVDQRIDAERGGVE